MNADLIRYMAFGDKGEESENFSWQLHKLTDWMPGGFFIYRAEGREELLYANEALLRIFLCDTMEEFRALTGNSFRGIVHPEDLDEVEESIREQIANSQYDLDYVEYRIIRKDGKVRWLEDYGHFIRSEEGNVFCVFVGDVTEKYAQRLQRESSLLSRIEEYHQELEGLNGENLRRLEVIEGLSLDYESIFYLDLKENTIQTYRSSGRVECQFEKECRTRTFSGFADGYIGSWVHPEDRELLSRTLTVEGIRDRLHGRGISDVTYRVLEGERVEYLQLHMVNVGEGGPAEQVIMAARSVDEMIRNGLRQREALESALKQSRSAAVARSTFLANMSHDIRTPMNAILGFTALARKHLEEPERLEEYLAMIEKAGNQLLHLVNDVLELTQVESGRVQLEEEPCDLAEIARAVQAALGSRAEKKGLDLSLDISGVSRSAVYGDRGKLEQILTLFADNAIKYTPAGGMVKLIVRELEGAAAGYGIYRLAVRDTGIGVGESFQKRLFAPFERERNTTLSGVPGTGLGLPIARGLAQLMGGEISVDSTPGKGSCFYVTLTLRLVQEPPAQGGDVLLPGTDFPGKVLVVEDNSLNREILRELLESEGFQVESAVHGRQAVDMVGASQPGEYGLILMDIQMPVMDGCQAARSIRALPDPAHSALPIIAVSANASEEDKKQSGESGMNAHLAKPVDLEQLLKTIQRVMAVDR